jgi:hypothetical protein
MDAPCHRSDEGQLSGQLTLGARAERLPFGIFWRRALVNWSSSARILGKQQNEARPVDFAVQKGVYLLYDRNRLVYVGRAVELKAGERPLGRRLFEHTTDRLNGRWDTFSWFGICPIAADGSIEQRAKPSITPETLIVSLEALLIEALEPPLNRRCGDGIKAAEYIQADDPEVKRRELDAHIKELMRLRDNQ